ncbi:MAG: tetratricopeptide repeat protein [Verrucomicrobiota bacterium]
MRKFLYFSLLLLVTWANEPAKVFSQSRGLAQEAEEAFSRGEYAKAIEFMTRYLGSDGLNDSQKATANYIIGVSHFNLGDHKKAIEALQKTKGIRPNQAPLAQFFLGSAYLTLKQHQEAIQTLERVLTLKAEEGDKETQQTLEEIKPLVSFTIIQCYKSQADQAQAVGDKIKAEEFYGDVASKVAQYLEDNPDTEFKQDALLIQVQANLITRDYAQAWSTLEALKKEDKEGILRDNIEFLMGQTAMEQGDKAKREKNKSQANEYYNRAKGIFKKLQSSSNLSFAADAILKLGLLDLNEGKFDQAFEIFNQVPSKRKIIVSQEKRIEEARKRMTATASSEALFKRNKRYHQREVKKLAQIKADQDPFMRAMLGVANAMIKLGKYDEARVLYRYFEPFMEEDQKKTTSLQIYFTYAQQGLTDKADKLYKDLLAKYPNDETVKRMSFLLPSSLMTQGKYGEAIEEFRKYITDNPDGDLKAEATYHIANCYMELKKTEEAIKAYQEYISAGGSDDQQFEDAQFRLANAYWSTGKKEKALDLIQKVINTAKSQMVKEKAAFTIARFYLTTKEIDKAIEAFKDYAKVYPDSKDAPVALFQVGRLLGELAKQDPTKYDAARSYFDQIIANYGDTAQAPKAYQKIWQLHQQKGDIEAKFKAQDELIQKYPKSPFVLAALKERSDHYLKVDKKLNKAIEALNTIYEFYKQRKAEGSALANKGGAAYNYGSYAIITIAGFYRKLAEQMGPPAVLSPEDMTKWDDRLKKASDLLWTAGVEFADTKEGVEAFKRWTNVALLRIANGVVKEKEVTQELSKQIGSTDSAKLQLQYRLALASIALERGKKKAASDRYEEAFSSVPDPRSISINNYDNYLKLLLDVKNYSKIKELSATLAEAYSDKEKAQATAIYYKALVALSQEDAGQADQLFNELKEKYPRSPKNFDALYYKGRLARDKKDYDQAYELWSQVVKSGRSSNQTKAEAQLELGKMLIEVAESGGTIKEFPQDVKILEVAAKQLEKLAITMDQFGEICAEALYHAAQSYEKLGNPQRAQKLRSEIRQKYPTSSWASRV